MNLTITEVGPDLQSQNWKLDDNKLLHKMIHLHKRSGRLPPYLNNITEHHD